MSTKEYTYGKTATIVQVDSDGTLTVNTADGQYIYNPNTSIYKSGNVDCHHYTKESVSLAEYTRITVKPNPNGFTVQ